MSNPLIGLEGLPPFSKIKPEYVVPALKDGIELCRKAIDDIIAHVFPCIAFKFSNE